MTVRPSASPSSIEVNREIRRKALHLPGLGIPWLGHHFPLLVLFGSVGISLLYLLSEQFRYSRKRPLPIFGSITSGLARSERLDPAPVFLALGLGLSAYFFSFQAAFCGALLACVCDGIAAILGMRFGKRRLPFGNKTWVGSGAFFLSAGLVLFPILPWEGVLITALVGTALEAISFKGIDNFLLPILGGMVAAQFP